MSAFSQNWFSHEKSCELKVRFTIWHAWISHEYCQAIAIILPVSFDPQHDR